LLLSPLDRDRLVRQDQYPYTLYTSEERPGLSSRDRDKMKLNDDGSVTLYVGPKAPKGYKNNWISTAGKVPYLLFRFYGPEEPLFNKTFVLNDVELVE
jgi:hypothetical protein